MSIDCGAILDGWHGDSAWTFGVGTIIEADELLSEATRLSMEAGIAAMMPGNRLTDVSHAIELGTRPPRRPTDASTASSTATAVTPSAARCTWIRSCRTRGPRQGTRTRHRLRIGHRADADPGYHETEVLDDDWTVVTTDGIKGRALGAHRRGHRGRPAILTLRPE